MKDRHEFYDRDGGHWVIENQHFAVWRDTKTGETHHTIYEPILCEEISSLAAEVEQLRAESEWRPIETAPKNGTEVLLWCERRQGHFIGVWDSSSDRWKSFGNTIYATHWMPMPEPPDEVNL